MEGFFDFIFGNIFIVVIIIAAIINFLGKGRQQQEREEQQRPQRQQRQRPANPPAREERTREERTTRTRLERSVEQARQTIETVQENVAKTFEEQRQEQYDRLKSQYQATTISDNDESEYSHTNIGEKSNLQPIKEEVSKVDVKLEDKLTAKGLIESVIMAEVLGPPRAHNPYQNIVVRRKQYKR